MLVSEGVEAPWAPRPIWYEVAPVTEDQLTVTPVALPVVAETPVGTESGRKPESDELNALVPADVTARTQYQ